MGTANHVAVTAQPPSSLIAGDGFGVVVAAESPAGDVDPAFSGTLTISLAVNPGGSTLGEHSPRPPFTVWRSLMA